MPKFTRIEVVIKMKKTGIVPLFYHADFEVTKNIMVACYKGGARVLEYTSRGDFAYEVFSRLLKYANAELPEMALGVGSVTDAGAASHYMLMGANFIVTPVFRKDIAMGCNRRKVLWLPGCGSLGEIAKAEELGCEIVKLFPGGTYGPEFVKSVLAPQPWTSIMPTGGVEPNEESLRKWFDAGVECVGLGSRLITNQIIENREYEKLEIKVKNVMKVISKIRTK